MEHLKQMLVREMSKEKNILLREAKKGAFDVEVTLYEDPGEVSYLYFVEYEDLQKAVKEAIIIILGEKAEAYNIFKEGRTVFFSVF